MMTRIKTLAARCPDTLVQDFLGAAALVVILAGALYLPVLTG